MAKSATPQDLTHLHKKPTSSTTDTGRRSANVECWEDYIKALHGPAERTHAERLAAIDKYLRVPRRESEEVPMGLPDQVSPDTPPIAMGSMTTDNDVTPCPLCARTDYALVTEQTCTKRCVLRSVTDETYCSTCFCHGNPNGRTTWTWRDTQSTY